MRRLAAAAMLLILFACGKEKESPALPVDETPSVPVPSLNYSLYEIREGGLGHISIGMSIKEAAKYTAGLQQKEAETLDFGFDGGGKSYMYYDDENPVFAIVPSRESDTIIAIVAIDKNLRTSDGLHPGMTVKELQAHFPATIRHDEMMDWEYITDGKNNFRFVFSPVASPIAARPGSNKPSQPIHAGTACDWIIIGAAGKCAMLRHGDFMYTDANGNNVLVKFENGVCTEKHSNGKYLLLSKIEWVGECEYENTLVMTTLPDFPFNPGTKMFVKIDRVEGSDFYFSAAVGGKLYKNRFTKI